MVLEDWFHFEPQCCGGVHCSASAGQLNDQHLHCVLLFVVVLLFDTANVLPPIGGY